MRIISGSARGRTVQTLTGLQTRPTLDRVRESVFGSLQFRVPGSAFLDVFSGSGAMGLEAASRGAARVVLNDSAPEAVRVIRQNAQNLGLAERVTVYGLDYTTLLETLARQGERFDLVYLDPPFASGYASDAAEKLFRLGLINDGGTVLCEHATSDVPFPGIPGVMRRGRTRKFGKCSVTEYGKDGDL